MLIVVAVAVAFLDWSLPLLPCSVGGCDIQCLMTVRVLRLLSRYRYLK